jgi:hypothetical protein
VTEFDLQIKFETTHGATGPDMYRGTGKEAEDSRLLLQSSCSGFDSLLRGDLLSLLSKLDAVMSSRLIIVTV